METWREEEDGWVAGCYSNRYPPHLPRLINLVFASLSVLLPMGMPSPTPSLPLPPSLSVSLHQVALQQLKGFNNVSGATAAVGSLQR